jgi:hypothetical protein
MTFFMKAIPGLGAMTLFALISPIVFAAESIERNSSAIPDFGGPWMSSHARKFTPSGDGPLPVIDHPEHPHTARATGPDGRDIGTTAWVGDWNNANLKPWVAEALRKAGEDDLAGIAHPTAESSCWPAGVPNIMNFFEPAFFLQGPDEVTIIYQRGPNVRHVYLNQPHSEEIASSWYGESVGHYEGDTLVIDTIGFNDETVLDRYMTPHSDRLHVVERYRVLGDLGEGDRPAQGDGFVFTGETMEVEFTVEDQEAFNEPWSAIARYRHVNRESLEESICAENNFNYHTGEEYPVPISGTRDF